MRTILIALTGLALLLAFASASPVLEARPAPACSNVNGGTCMGIVCVDENLDGKFTYGECVIMLCPEYGCCGYGCPPPPYE
jgi:hypothetical protein